MVGILRSGGLVIGALVLTSCAKGPEAARAETVAGQRLQCKSAELESELLRETPKVREYVVGCDFVIMRVHCTNETCAPAPEKPPCIGDTECFEEDPVTLEWVLPERDR